MGSLLTCIRVAAVGWAWRVAMGIVAGLVGGCSAAPSAVADFRDCRASCVRPGSDGDSCEAWAPSAAAVCQLRFSALPSCCSPDGRTVCTATRPAAAGAPCVCRSADARGVFVVQGFSCRPS